MSRKIKVVIENNDKYRLVGDLKALTRLYKAFKVKHPGAFFLRKSGNVRPNWDGCKDYITPEGRFSSGLLQSVFDKAKELGIKVKIKDLRNDFNIKPKLPKKIGNQIPRPYQNKSIESVITNSVGKHLHPICVIDAATNAGKTTIMAGIHLAYRSKVPTIILLKDGDLFEQFKRELPELLPNEKIGFVRGKNIDFQHVTVAMVQTLSPKAKLYINHLTKFGICLVDEADEGGSKTYTNIIKHLFNCRIRVGLSGTIYMSKLKKMEMKNQDLRCFFGDVTFKITKKEMVNLGFSTNLVIKIHKGSDLPSCGSYPEEYDLNITKNKKRIKKAIELMRYNMRLGRIPALVIFRFHEHGELIYKMFKKAFPNNSVKLVHGGINKKDRNRILGDFKVGKIDILISSYIIKRGKNHPMIKYLQNQASGDSQETVSQLMGRAERTHDSKKKSYIDDFMDEGKYLKRHSKHRQIYYKKEGFKVLTKY